MDFVVGLSQTFRGYDNIWVIVDRLIKSAHFILVRSTFNAKRLACVYLGDSPVARGAYINYIRDRGS